MNRQQTNTIVRGFPSTRYNRSRGKNNHFVKHKNNGDRKQYNRPTINTNSSSRDVREHKSRFAKGPGLVGNGFTMDRSLTLRSRQSYIDSDQSSAVSSKSPTPVSHMEIGGVEPVKEENIKTPGMETQTGKVTRDRLLETFRMTGSWINGQHKSPDVCANVKVDSNGIMQFLITNKEMYDTGIPLLLKTLTDIHKTCMLMRMRAQRARPTNKSDAIALRCICVDPFEVSWAIQIHLFKMYKIGVRCIVLGVNNTLCIDKNILLSLVRESLTRTYMSEENAYYAFNIISTIIVDEWHN
jgi:hypothetical protein